MQVYQRAKVFVINVVSCVIFGVVIVTRFGRGYQIFVMTKDGIL